MYIDSSSLTPTERYYLLTACIIPRPIALVTSVSPEGVVNAAPFSFFNGVSANPPTVIIAVERRRGGPKDTARNIRLSNEFVINIVTEDIVDKMNITSASFPRHISEIEEAGFTLRPSQKVKTQGIAESPIQLECTLSHSMEIGNGPTDLLFGEVVAFQVRDDLMENGRIVISHVKAVGRLSGSGYCTTREIFEMRRPG